MKRFILCGVALATGVGVATVAARNLDGRWSGAPNGEWYQAQIVPGGPHKGTSCCSSADGAKAEAEVRDGHWWVRFEACGWWGDGKLSCKQVEWMQVPDEAVLNNFKNPNGVPIVWWGHDGEKIIIRCFAREIEA